MLSLKKRLRRPFKGRPLKRLNPLIDIEEFALQEEEFPSAPCDKKSLLKKWLKECYHQLLSPKLESLYQKISPPKRLFNKETLPKEYRKPITNMLASDLERLIQDFQQLKQSPSLCRDPRFLCRMATDLKQLSHDAALGLRISTLKKKARLIRHLLTTPFGAPYVSRMTFLEAADIFSEQEPRHSDLANLLQNSLTYGCKFEKQIRSLINLSQHR
jgi:hypothetical protein